MHHADCENSAIIFFMLFSDKSYEIPVALRIHDSRAPIVANDQQLPPPL